jgi:hypothetical protein
MYLFNRPVDKWPKFPRWFYFYLIDDDMHKSWRVSFNRASYDELCEAISLPNFDYDVFEEISGISKSDFQERIGVHREND